MILYYLCCQHCLPLVSICHCLYFHSNGGSEFLGSVFHKVTKDLESGITMSWVTGTSETRFGFGAKYNADKDTTFRVKRRLMASFFYILNFYVIDSFCSANKILDLPSDLQMYCTVFLYCNNLCKLMTDKPKRVSDGKHQIFIFHSGCY